MEVTNDPGASDYLKEITAQAQAEDKLQEMDEVLRWFMGLKNYRSLKQSSPSPICLISAKFLFESLLFRSLLTALKLF